MQLLRSSARPMRPYPGLPRLCRFNPGLCDGIPLGFIQAFWVPSPSKTALYGQVPAFVGSGPLRSGPACFGRELAGPRRGTYRPLPAYNELVAVPYARLGSQRGPWIITDPQGKELAWQA